MWRSALRASGMRSQMAGARVRSYSQKNVPEGYTDPEIEPLGLGKATSGLLVASAGAIGVFVVGVAGVAGAASAIAFAFGGQASAAKKEGTGTVGAQLSEKDLVLRELWQLRTLGRTRENDARKKALKARLSELPDE